MTDHEDLFAKGQQIPAAFKHALLVKYLMPFVTMTSKTNTDRRVWYIGGYAGAATYDATGDGSEPAAGSPVLALRIAQKAKASAGAVDMRCVFVEADPSHAALLTSMVEQYQFKEIQQRALTGAIEACIQQLVVDVGSDPLLDNARVVTTS